MKKKNEVYVVVDTPKKSKKLKRVLDMFGENVYSLRFKYCSMGDLYKDEWHSGSTPSKNKTEVSIKELRNILAKEHLKAGDVVFMRSFRDEYESILKIKGVEGEYLKVDKQLFVKGSDSTYTYGQELIKDFIRYATEEEKALLEPKKELEVGKWYKTPQGGLYCVVSIEDKFYNAYGFSVSGYWFENKGIPNGVVGYDRLSTPQEVEQALIEEAKRRGFVNGCIGNNSNIHDTSLEDCELFFNNEYEFDKKYNLLRVVLDDYTTWIVFKDGKWATIIEQGNFTDYDIGIVERLHDTLLDNHGYSLESKLLTDARLLSNKIKSNIK